jgi:hypothetical protein
MDGVGTAGAGVVGADVLAPPSVPEGPVDCGGMARRRTDGRRALQQLQAPRRSCMDLDVSMALH